MKSSLATLLTAICAVSTAVSYAAGQEREEPGGRIFVRLMPESDARIAGVAEVQLKDGTWRILFNERVLAFRVSPDGRRIVYWRRDDPQKNSIVVRELEGGGEAKTLADGMGSFAWSPDGQELIVSHASPTMPKNHHESFRIKADGSGRMAAPIAENEVISDWSIDGQWLLVAHMKPGNPKESNLSVIHPDGTGKTRLNKLGPRLVMIARFCPDPTEILGLRTDFLQGGQGPSRPTILTANRDTGALQVLVRGTENTYPLVACPSPDGSWVAFSCALLDSGRRGQLQFIRADGTDRRQIALPASVAYVGGWLPEPPASDAEPEVTELEQADSLILIEVQRDLRLSDEQKVKATRLTKEFMEFEERRLAHAKPDALEERKARSKAFSEWRHEIDKLLKPEQLTRLKQIAIQRSRFFALAEPCIQSQLKLTPDQVAKLEDLRMQHYVAAFQERQKLIEAHDANRDEEVEQSKRKLSALEKETVEKCLKLLTPEQRLRWDQLLGPPFKMQP